METSHRQRRSRRREQRGQAADKKDPRDAARQRRARDSRDPGDAARDQVMRERQKRDEWSVRCVGFAVDPAFAVEDRCGADDAAVDDRRLPNLERLRDGEIAGVDEMFGLEVRLEFVGHAKRVARRGQRVERLEKDEEQDGRPAVALHFSDSIHTCSVSAARSRTTTARWLRIAWENRDELPFAWRILSDGVCDGCALGTSGLSDWTLRGVHLCMVRLELMRLNTAPALDPSRARRRRGAARARRRSELRALGRLPRADAAPRAASAGFASSRGTRRSIGSRRSCARVDPQRARLLPDVARHHQRGLLRGAEGGAVPRHQPRRQLRAAVPRGVDRRR